MVWKLGRNDHLAKGKGEGRGGGRSCSRSIPMTSLSVFGSKAKILATSLVRQEGEESRAKAGPTYLSCHCLVISALRHIRTHRRRCSCWGNACMALDSASLNEIMGLVKSTSGLDRMRSVRTSRCVHILKAPLTSSYAWIGKRATLGLVTGECVCVCCSDQGWMPSFDNCCRVCIFSSLHWESFIATNLPRVTSTSRQKKEG